MNHLLPGGGGVGGGGPDFPVILISNFFVNSQNTHSSLPLIAAPLLSKKAETRGNREKHLNKSLSHNSRRY